MKLPKLKKPGKKTIIILLAIIILAAVGIFLMKDKLGIGENTGAVTSKTGKGWELILVNKDNPLSEDFKVNLQEIKGGKVDSRITEALLTMQIAAKEQGVNLIITSAYRNVPKQKQLYEQEINNNIAQGLGEEKSIEAAGKYINPPGASEHHTGLAIDFLTDGHAQLNETFAETEAYKWLQENAAAYGFIERYPKGKEEQTKINWEPWHYRYVGIDNATKMNEQSLCLEEY